MRGKNTLVINGKVYDAITGLPVGAPDAPAISTPAALVAATPISVTTSTQKSSAKSRTPHHAGTAHKTTQKSATLRRDVLKKPVSKVQVGSARHRAEPGHVARSEQIKRFALHPQPLAHTVPHPRTGRKLDIAPAKSAPSSIVAQKHALVAKASPKPAPPALSSRALKEHLIKERLAHVDTSTRASTTSQRRAKSRFFARQPRMANIVVASFAVMVLGGYLTYLNMPGISVRVAAAQADVAASFPDYHPDGYRFNGPVAFAPGQVSINFQANGGNAGYTVTEQKSSWDSQAVYDNIVAKTADDNYVTNSQQGLTIYTFKGEAAWVNKGILYTIEGNAPLNNEQLLRIASSL